MSRKALRNWMLAVGGSGILAAATFGLWLWNDLSTPYYAANATETFVEIPRGAGPHGISDRLVQSGILRNRLPFVLYLRWTGAAHRLRAGEYRFARPQTPIQIARKLLRGEVHYVAITMPEGLTAEETASRLAAAGLANLESLRQEIRRTDAIRDLAPKAASLEGYLFPETYRFPRNTSAADIIARMVREFRSRFAGIAAEAPIPEGWDLPKVVTLASLVEKEVGRSQERALVASVLLNRLKLRMPLGCDPTVIYALKLAGRYDGNIRKADLAIDSPYNTYVNPGLPPGPIANPGAEAIKAVLDPAVTDYLYYVSRNDGTHHFSKDFRSHLAAVNRFQRNQQ